MEPYKTKRLNGRNIEFFRRMSDPAWGYDPDREDSYAVIHPENRSEGALYPLYVVFHSAGHDLESTIECMKTPGDHDIYHTPSDCFALVLDCKEHHPSDWWWGGRDALEHGYGHHDRDGIELQPVEKRCIATIESVLDGYPCDRDRVYAVGNSMGGSGALGIALRRGDLFAAIKANVPAGVRHAADRCCLDRDPPDGFSIPDPPPVIDYSAQNDGWSAGHEILYRGMRDKKYALMGFFGPFGHENDDSKINAVNDLVHAFDIRSVVRNEAYPVFCGATTDDPIPWPDERDRTDSGQVNAFFRWRVITDEPDRFEIELRLLREDEWQTRVKLPEESTADLYLRRLQRFKFEPDADFTYTYNGEERVGHADKDALPEMKSVTVTKAPKRLVITK